MHLRSSQKSCSLSTEMGQQLLSYGGCAHWHVSGHRRSLDKCSQSDRLAKIGYIRCLQYNERSVSYSEGPAMSCDVRLHPGTWHTGGRRPRRRLSVVDCLLVGGRRFVSKGVVGIV